MIRFVDHPWVLWLVPVVAFLAVAGILAGHRRRQSRLARFGTPEALERLGPGGLARPPRARALRLGAAAAALAMAVAGPRWGEGRAIVDSDGIDVALALDVSLSMLAEDERPNRLERLKQEVRRMRATAPGDRVALLAFAGRSYILSPLTSDDGAIELFLENLDPTIVGVAGSAFASPLRQGIDLLSASRGGADRALVVMSDGEAFDDKEAVFALAREAREKNIHLVTVGFGTPGGAPIPLLESGGTEVKRDENGEIVVTRYDEVFLRDLAYAAGGEFIAADATDKGNRVRRALAHLEAERREEEQRLARPPRFQWFAVLAFALLLLDIWLADGGRRVLRRAFAAGVLALATLAAPVRVEAQGAELRRAIAAHRAGRLPDAIRRYRAVVAEGDRRPIVLYDLGTALLAADSVDAAIDALERAAFTTDPDLRSRALYNLGTAHLRRGLRAPEGDQRSNALRSARRALRTVLLERPGDADAQWNYELALHAPQGGGGGGGAPPPPQQQSQPRPTEPQGQMSRQQAEALLEGAAREERETQARRQRGSRPQRATGERDW